MVKTKTKDNTKTKTFGVHPIQRESETYGEFHHLFEQLIDEEEKFLQYYRMKMQTCTTLLELCREDPTKETRRTQQKRQQISRDLFLALNLTYCLSVWGVGGCEEELERKKVRRDEDEDDFTFILHGSSMGMMMMMMMMMMRR